MTDRLRFPVARRRVVGAVVAALVVYGVGTMLMPDLVPRLAFLPKPTDHIALDSCGNWDSVTIWHRSGIVWRYSHDFKFGGVGCSVAN